MSKGHKLCPMQPNSLFLVYIAPVVSDQAMVLGCARRHRVAVLAQLGF